MKRLLFAYPEVAPLYSNGGIGTYVFEAAILLAATGHWEIDILTDTSYGGAGAADHFESAAASFARAGIRLFDLERADPEPPGWSSPDTTRAERYHRHVQRLHHERGYDVIEFPDWKAPGFFAVRSKVTTGAFNDTRLVLHLHSSTRDVWEWQDGDLLGREDFYAHYMEEYVKRHADVVLSPTEYLLSAAATRATEARLELRNGYPIASGTGPFPIVGLRRTAGDPVTIACISRLELRKGQDILARAIRNLARDESLGELSIAYCGRDSLGLQRDGLMSASIRRILMDVDGWRIIPAKGRDELAQWLAEDVDISVVPSRGDNYPNVVLESGRAGCQLVCSDAGGIPEVLRDYDIDALVFPADDADALEARLRDAVARVRADSDSRAQRAARFEAARRRQSARTVATYDKIAGDRPRIVIPRSSGRAPSVSVIIPFHNAHDFVHDAVASAFASDHPDFEVILVDDGSDQPEAAAALRALEAEFPGLRVIRKPNGGLGDARNAGIAAARGEFVVPLDADNLLMPGMLGACSRVLARRPELAYVTTYFECLLEDGSRLPWQLSPIAKPIGAVDPLLMLENTAGDALAMVRKSALEAVGGYSTSIYCFEDWDLWLTFREHGFDGDVLPQVLFQYRVREDSMSRSLNAYHGARLHQALLRRHQQLLQDQAFPVSTLLLQEYWPRWRPAEAAGSLAEQQTPNGTPGAVVKELPSSNGYRHGPGALAWRLKRTALRVMGFDPEGGIRAALSRLKSSLRA